VYDRCQPDRIAVGLRFGLGIAPGRILAITKGEESPVCTESSESCWQQNRRAHSMIMAK
jgi:peptidoglycan-associated lipoprotein